MAHKTIKVLVLLGLLPLAGCLAFGVPYSSDPNILIGNAYEMMRQGRPLPAKQFIDDALEKFRAEGNELGMAEAYHTYGNFYKNRNLGFKRYEESEENFRKALVLYEKHNNYAGMVKSHFGIGNTYRSRDTAKECDEYRQSLLNYQKGIKSNPDLDKQIGLLNPHFRNTGDMITAFMTDIGCKQNS